MLKLLIFCLLRLRTNTFLWHHKTVKYFGCSVPKYLCWMFCGRTFCIRTFKVPDLMSPYLLYPGPFEAGPFEAGFLYLYRFAQFFSVSSFLMTDMILKKDTSYSEIWKLIFTAEAKITNLILTIVKLELYTKFKIQILRLAGEWEGGGGIRPGNGKFLAKLTAILTIP